VKDIIKKVLKEDKNLRFYNHIVTELVNNTSVDKGGRVHAPFLNSKTYFYRNGLKNELHWFHYHPKFYYHLRDRYGISVRESKVAKYIWDQYRELIYLEYFEDDRHLYTESAEKKEKLFQTIVADLLHKTTIKRKKNYKGIQPIVNIPLWKWGEMHVENIWHNTYTGNHWETAVNNISDTYGVDVNFAWTIWEAYIRRLHQKAYEE
jgi:hypothetical protein